MIWFISKLIICFKCLWSKLRHIIVLNCQSNFLFFNHFPGFVNFSFGEWIYSTHLIYEKKFFVNGALLIDYIDCNRLYFLLCAVNDEWSVYVSIGNVALEACNLQRISFAEIQFVTESNNFILSEPFCNCKQLSCFIYCFLNLWQIQFTIPDSNIFLLVLRNSVSTK